MQNASRHVSPGTEVDAETDPWVQRDVNSTELDGVESEILSGQSAEGDVSVSEGRPDCGDAIEVEAEGPKGRPPRGDFRPSYVAGSTAAEAAAIQCVAAPIVVLEDHAPEEALTSFISIHDMGAAMRASKWTVAQETDLLAAIAQGLVDGATVRDRMAAANRLRQNAIMALRINGRITDTKKVLRGQGTATDGSPVTLEVVQRTAQLLRDAHREALACSETEWLRPHETVSSVAEKQRLEDHDAD